ncbi:UDP-N-acetylglucosamine 2-epimerase (non-hydrolysing) [Candidatus Hakubella thermalkaliphila]|uniref:UDP-N-acetylglucosamine 2-epimerase (Non-hydrolysing) n=1 Tax=Candidatus Hakubella thermalkaliphila TaxID=2754717 RepID=A0A6V8PKV1_9ACTN|nr:UDP-N-acetylglucosamine 2-epimerase (non-hydrolysing) [Candidatus Hakubella thermalkaliphila]
MFVRKGLKRPTLLKVLLIFGTRPEAIEMAPVAKAIEKSPDLKGIVCVAAQHREMLDQLLKFSEKPDIDLNLTRFFGA